MNAPSSTPASPAMAGPSSGHGPMHTTLVTPYGIEPQDVPWLADLIARQAVRLLDVRHLQDLTLSVSVGPNCTLHTAQLLQQAAHGPSTGTGSTNYSTTLVALKQYHRPADLIFEVHQLLTTPISQYTNPFLGIVQLGEHGLTCLVVPYHPLGNLRQYIADQRANLTALQQLQIIHDIASGLEFLHQRGIQHLNLHSANVLISLQGMAILTDFGRPNNRAEVGMPPKPTPELERVRSLAVVFLAPEVLASNSYSSRSEVYALGMVMFELLTGKVAFEKDLHMPGLSTRVMFGRQEEIPANISGSPGQAYEALIKDCWKLNPAERPHLSELKSRLEQLMADCRSKSDTPKALQPSQRPLDSSTRSLTATSNIITTTVVVPSHARIGVDGPKMSPTGTQQQQQQQQQHQQQQQRPQSSSTDKPLETWTIGQASSSPAAQPRDAIPISSRALEISSGQRKNSSGLHSGQIFIAQSVDKALPPLPNAETVATAIPPMESQPAQAQDQQQTPAPKSRTSQEADAQNGRGKSPNPFWPMPPNYHHSKLATAKPTVKDAAGPTPNAQVKPVVSTPAPEASPYSTSSTATTSWPRPPAARGGSGSSGSDVVTRSYATAPTATSPSPASVSSATTSSTSASAQSEVRPLPISIPTRTTSVIPPGASPSPAPSSISPDTLFNTGRNTILAAATSERKQWEEGPMPTFFNWRQSPSSMDKDAEHRKIQSAATAVTVTEVAGSLTGTAQEPVVVGAGSTVVEPIMTSTAAGLLPATTTSQPPTPVDLQPQSPTTGATDRHGRESILIIPVFPEPPSTLHNRRISNMDIRFRQAAVRQYTMPRLQGQQQQHGRAASYEDLEAESRMTVRSPHRASSIIGVMSPQEAPTSPTGLAARGAYTPIMSSEDVPTASPSNSIHSAARNGDLVELQQFLNDVTHRSVSNGSGVGKHKHHPPRQGSSGSQQQRGLSSAAADILDEFEPIERLPVLCCAAVARKNKYQALNMVLRAGANVEGKEQRGGNTPLHLVCETAPPPDEELKPAKKSAAARYREEENGARGPLEKAGVTTEDDAALSQLSLLDVDDQDEDSDVEEEDEGDQGHEAALRRADEMDEQEQEALDRVKDDLELVFSISTNDDGTSSLTISRQQAPAVLGGAHYTMKNQILPKGGLEDQIRLLVLAGCPVDTPNHRGETPLLLLLRFHDSMTALATLLRMGANPMHMAPFGPGTNPAEIHVDPKTLMSSPSAQKRMSKRLFSSKPISLQSPQRPLVGGDEDPNHILVMHGSALAHAAYYLRVKCVRYLLEHEIECSDPAVIEQAIVACQHSVAAKVNPPLVATQRRILRLLERDWRGQAGERHRAHVAEKTLNRTRKPVRSSALLVALAVSSSSSSSSPTSEVFPLGPKEHSSGTGLPASGYAGTRVGAGVGAGGPFKQPVYPGRTSSSMLGAIPTTHLYATDGPMGPGIEVISQHGFQIDSSTPRFKLTDRSMDKNGYDGHGAKEAQDWRASAGGGAAVAHDFGQKSPKAVGQDGEANGLFRKLRNRARS